MSNQLTFNEVTHTYTLNGLIVLSVTQVLEAEGFFDYKGLNPFYAQRGTAVHAATWLDDQGLLDEATVDPQIVGHLAAWRKFRRESGFMPIGGELPLSHAIHRYAGTPDRWDVGLLVDIKTGQPSPWHVLQRAAYRELLRHDVGVKIKRDLCVYLKTDGTYTTSKESSSTQALSVFLSALALNRWKEQHGNGTRNT